MVSPRVLEFGRIYGFSPGLDGPTPDVASLEQLEEYRELHSKMADVDKDGFWAEVSAEYLPCILKTAMKTRPLTSFYEDFVYLANHLRLKADLPYEHRFVRDHPEEALAFHLFLREAIYNMPDEAYEVINGESVFSPVLRSFGMALHLSFTSLFFAYPGSSFPFPKEHALPSTEQISSIRRLVERVVFSPELKLSPDDLEALLDLPEDINHMALLDPVAGREKSKPERWEACEWASVEEQQGRKIECERFAEGEEMMTCGRCKTVRYCSRDHQRAGWTEHRDFCFKTSW